MVKSRVENKFNIHADLNIFMLWDFMYLVGGSINIHVFISKENHSLRTFIQRRGRKVSKSRKCQTNDVQFSHDLCKTHTHSFKGKTSYPRQTNMLRSVYVMDLV
jgi:hypothetical protein